ncbi:YqhA family protein [Chitinophaga barathri]|uniref:YqhA family protein n=1 Tax=Chitinophaga barathri TaxID=1647451 RepID=A0A3N4N2E7_9BACT|nr:YqhA family protein [Chitinophaga barathri]RPD41803.1 hypothetical protein EG028_06445 [Chitinophaga barathri]
MKRLLRYRVLYIIISVFCALNALVFVMMGVVKAVHAYITFSKEFFSETPHEPAMLLLQSLDNFLMALVLLIFAFGIYRIFVDMRLEEDMPAWLREVKTLRDLKLMLWEAILVIMLIFSISYMNSHRLELGWHFLILPGIILMVALSYFLMKRAEK